ncbi:MAG: PASTA domain-containing protein [Salinivirgaceae bacterium]|nr:PASTA domain-containing protein [Salinivirgaceae bacterium]
MAEKENSGEKSPIKQKLIRIGIIAELIIAFYIVVFVIFTTFLRFYTHHNQSISVPDFKSLTLQRAAQIAAHENLQLRIIDSTFIDYMPRGSIIDQSPRPGTHVKRNRTIFLTTNAFCRAKVEMPRLVGLSYRQGKATLEMLGLHVGQLIYQPDFAKNNILKQMHNNAPIAAGTMIETGSKIDLVLGDGYESNYSIPLPNLKGKTYFEAANELNNAYLNVGNVTITDAFSPADTINAKVYKQSPAYYNSDSRAPIGAKIDIWLSPEQ